MRFLYYVLPFLGITALASEFATDECQCPQVKCPSNDAVVSHTFCSFFGTCTQLTTLFQALCNCLNGRETLCKKRCPDYKPTYRV
jgi:hypothetical protein